MAKVIYKYPPVPSSGDQTFSDNIVGLQTVTGGGLTQGNFEFTATITEKNSRKFNIGVFSDPISLDSLNIGSLEESKAIIAKDFRVYPNFDLSEITRFNLYGPLTKRLSTSIQKIINFFPAAIELYSLGSNYNTGYTAYDCYYDNVENTTTFKVDVLKMSNPFDIDHSINASRNIEVREYEVSPLRNMTKEYLKYSLFIGDDEYGFLTFVPSNTTNTGYIEIGVNGNPFSSQTQSTVSFTLRPNSYYTDKSFIEPFDEVEQFLLNQLVVPKYTATFQMPAQTENGQIYINYENVTWPIDGIWNLDIRTIAFDNYLAKISEIADSLDSSRTNLVVRFLTTESFKEFDTEDQRVQKILSIYGRSFDEVKKFIDALAFMNSINYTVKNDIPSQLLKNLANTLGWDINISPITNEQFLGSVFGNDSQVQFPGYSRAITPTELNYQYYRNLILNSAYLFKSKGTRKSIEGLLRLIGAPEPLIEFNEHIYLAGQRIEMSDFTQQYAQISGGTYAQELPAYDPSVVYSIYGVTYTGFTTETILVNADTLPSEYPVDSDGYPNAVTDSEDYFFQKGAGWFELVKHHQSPQEVNTTESVFTGQNFNIQTQFEPFTYGQKYLDRYRTFPYMRLGFELRRIVDNKKSWTMVDDGIRVGSGGYNAYYRAGNERLVINVKNVDLFLNPGQGLSYDVWYMSRQYDYPIPSTGLTTPYPIPGGIDWTFINPQPSKMSFFEFAQTFWLNTINVRNRLLTSDGKTSGYPTLSSIYWKYLLSNESVGIPNDNFTYQSMINYVQGLGDYWIRLVEQMIPATTIWLGGVKFENSIFHRQKFVYRLQRGCEIVPIPCEPCTINTTLFPYDCIDETVYCPIYPWLNGVSTANSFSDVLYQAVSSYLSSQGLTLSDCISSTLITTWFIDLRVDGDILLQQEIYTGYGLLDVPSNIFWKTQLDTYLPDLIYQGYSYLIDGDYLYISNSGCDGVNTNKVFYLNVGLNFSINCN